MRVINSSTYRPRRRRRAHDGVPLFGLGPAGKRLDAGHDVVVAVDAGLPEPGAEQCEVGADEGAADVEEDGREIVGERSHRGHCAG